MSLIHEIVRPGDMSELIVYNGIHLYKQYILSTSMIIIEWLEFSRE